MIDLPLASKTIKDRVKNDIRAKLPLSNAFLSISWMGALADSLGERVFDFNFGIKRAILQIMPDTTTMFIDRWASYFNLSRNSATQSSGYINFTGVLVLAHIPDGSILVDGNQNRYIAQESKFTDTKSIIVTSITQSAGIATVTTPEAHNLTPGFSLTVSGANQDGYNKSTKITPTGEFTFTYEVDSSTATTATGTIRLSIYGSNTLRIRSEGSGSEVNLQPYTILFPEETLPGVDEVISVDHNGLSGGVDRESGEQLKGRYLFRMRNPIAHFSVSDIEVKSRTVPGVTRVFVEPITPEVGQVTVYFMTDNDDSPIPSVNQVGEVKNALLQIKPAETSDADVIVSAPTQVTVNFAFTSLSPDSVTMRDAVAESLVQFFTEDTKVGVDVSENGFNAAIKSTIDVSTGENVESFALSSPAGDVTIASGEIGVLGTVTF